MVKIMSSVRGLQRLLGTFRGRDKESFCVIWSVIQKKIVRLRQGLGLGSEIALFWVLS